MLVNSLFLDFLMENGLFVSNSGATRDVIGLEFNFKTRSYRDELDHLYKTLKGARNEYRSAVAKDDQYLIDKAKNKIAKLNQLFEATYENKDQYTRRLKDKVRSDYYNNGVDVKYVSRKKDGTIYKEEVIHYKMLFRSTGKAKKGSCMFIRDELFDKARNFLYMGIKLPATNAPIVEISAYAPLVASGIVGYATINPRNILVLNDVKRYFTRDVVSIETDKHRHCYARWLDEYELSNELFDGQALIDDSVFPEWANGYVLLRHHFTKMAAFHANIKQFFRDWCEEHGKDYSTYTVKDIWGNDHYVKDIELITTNNAVKWIKFNLSYDYWCKWVESNDCKFGVVKYSHPSKLGNYQRMSYQMLNSLDETTMESVCAETVNYIKQLKNNNEVFFDYLRHNINFANDYNVLLALCEWNPEFVRCSYFRERKSRIIREYVNNAKSGRLIQNADNLVIVGSPYAMLLYGATGNPDDVDLDTTLLKEQGTIQCYTSRFDDGEYLAGFRSPFNGKFNMSYLHNHYDDRIKKYFKFSDQIIAINMIGTDCQDRNNGSDQDSDSMYVTNQPDIVRHAEYCYRSYPTIVNNIPKDTNKYNNTMDDYAAIDNALAKSQLDIGLSSNLAQLAQTYSYTFHDRKYDDYVAILSVIAQAAIDSAKRRFDINISDEIVRIQKDMDIDTNGYPKFWLSIKKNFNKEKINPDLHCPMNYLADLKLNKMSYRQDAVGLWDFMEHIKYKGDRKQSRKVEEWIEKYSIRYYASIREEYIYTGEYDKEFLLIRSDFDELINDIRQIRLSTNYRDLVCYLINRAFLLSTAVKNNSAKLSRKTDKNRSILLKVLYEVNPKLFLSCFLRELPPDMGSHKKK